MLLMMALMVGSAFGTPATTRPVMQPIEVDAYVQGVFDSAMMKGPGYGHARWLRLVAELRESVEKLAHGEKEDQANKHLIRQLTLWLRKNHREYDLMFANCVNDWMGWEPEDRISALLPYFETGDENLQDAIFRMIDHFPEHPFAAEPTYPQVDPWLFSGNEPRLMLVKMMYLHDPDAALRTLLFAHRDSTKTGQEHIQEVLRLHNSIRSSIIKHSYDPVISADVKPDPEAMDSLRKLATEEKWWVRLYVAEMLCRYPLFRQTELVERLARDENAEVRRVADKIQHDQAKHQHHGE
jgi:hypothetical protein